MVPVLLCSLLLAPLPRVPRPRPRAPLPVLPVSISISVKSATGETRAISLPKQPKAQPRVSAAIKAGDKPQIRWQVRNLDSKAPIRNVVVHFLIRREVTAGTQPRGGPDKGALVDSLLGTELSPRGASTGDYNTAIHEPGAYLVEVELLDPQGNRRQYCALDLKVERSP